MQHLEALTREAAALATGALPLTADEGEVARTLQICNACRYCEGFCAVFPAMTRRLEFNKADIHYLANLCHNCGACYHACQYAPPHEFAVNIPQAMAKVRVQTYGDYAFPAALGGLYRRAGLTMALALAGGMALFLVMVLAMRGTLLHEPLAGNFYAIFPHNLLAAMFGVVFVFAMVALGIGVTRFWRRVSPGVRSGETRGAALLAARPTTRSGSSIWMAATARAATTTMTRSRCCAAASTTSRSTVSCCALRRPWWPRSITICSTCTRRIRCSACR